MSRSAAALHALDAAGIDAAARKEPGAGDRHEVDVWIEPRDLDVADAVLGDVGFHRFATPADPGHRFYLGLDDDGRWVKLDAKLSGTRTPGALGAVRTAVRRRLPLAARRQGPVVAVLGPDGSGKGSVIDALRRSIPAAVSVVYLGRPRRVGGPARSRPPPGAVREVAFVLRKAVRVWATIAGAYGRAWRGHIVLCDRHPVEVLAVRPPRRRLAGALERLLTVRLVPRPDAIVLLDAPTDVLRERKDEHPPEVLERWREAYRAALVPRGAVVVATDRPLEESTGRVAEVVWAALARRRRW